MRLRVARNFELQHESNTLNVRNSFNESLLLNRDGFGVRNGSGTKVECGFLYLRSFLKTLSAKNCLCKQN